MGHLGFGKKSVLVLFVMPLIKDFRNCSSFYVAIECSIVPSFMYSFTGFSGDLLCVLVYDFKLKNICFRMVVNGAVLKHCASG